MKDYSNYSVDNFIVDEKFRDWIVSPTLELDTFWESWLARHPEKSNELFKAKIFIQSLDDPVKSKPTSEHREDEIFEKIMENRGSKSNRWYSDALLRNSYKIAASISILLAFGLILFFFEAQNVDKAEISEQKIIERKTANGEKLTLKLPDQTKVKVNAGSKFRFPERFGNVREVYLDSGEAFFDVEHDIKRPFIVHVGGLSVNVLGTSFNVYNKKEKTKVALVSGSVSIFNSGDTLSLIPGKIAVVDSSGSMIKPFQYNHEIGWKDGLLVFDQDDLPTVANKLEQWFGCEVIFDKKQVVKRRFYGHFKNLSLVEVLQGLSFTSNINYEINEKTVTLKLNKNNAYD